MSEALHVTLRLHARAHHGAPPLFPQVSEALHVTLRLHASAHHGAPPLFPQVSEALHVTLRLPKPVQVDAAARATHGSTS